ncbi:MAG: hypothetical protein ACPGOV_08600 [Magnetovibrionaceae bacterium]
MTDEEKKQLREEMAAAMDIPLYVRFNGAQAAKIIGISHATLDRARSRGEIAYFKKGGRFIEYFGFQIIDYFIDQTEPREVNRQQQAGHVAKQRDKPGLDPKLVLETAKRNIQK